MTDYASKKWLRPHRAPFVARAIDFVFRVLVVLLIVLALAWIIGHNETRAAGVYLVLLETSSEPATLDECQRTHPARGRPISCISKQDRSGEPWHHRVCIYAAQQAQVTPIKRRRTV